MIESEQKILVGGILKFHGQLERVDGYDHIIFPPVYNQVGDGDGDGKMDTAQVVTFAIYAYFSLSLISEQVAANILISFFAFLDIFLDHHIKNHFHHKISLPTARKPSHQFRALLLQIHF